MSDSPVAQEVIAAPSAPLARFTAANRFAPIHETATKIPDKPTLMPYITWLTHKTPADKAAEYSAQIGAVAVGTPILVDNGTYRRLDASASTLLLAEYRYFAQYDFNADGIPLTHALPEEPEGNDQKTGYKEGYQVLCLHVFADPDIRPVVTLSRMLAAQCAWVNDLVRAVLAAQTPEWLAEQARRDSDLGAALASLPSPRLRVIATLSGRRKGAYVATKARCTGHTRATWEHLGRALVDGPDNAEADIDAGNAAFAERVAEVEAVIEETQYRASSPRGKKR